MNRVSRILIGKSVARTAVAVLRGATQNVVDGEVLVLDKNMSIMTAGQTIANTDVIYIAQILADTATYTNVAGTIITERKMIISPAIQGANVKNYIGKSYATPVMKVVTVTPNTPVVTQEYIVRVVYTDKAGEGFDGQTVQQWNCICTSAVTATHLASFAAIINADTKRRIAASVVGNTLLITALDNSEELTQIGNKIQANFEVAYNTVVLGVTSTAATIATSTNFSAGSGSWGEIRDIENACKGYRGATNKYQNPPVGIDSTFYTVKNQNYDIISIEHNSEYVSADNQYPKQSGLTTIIALPEPAGQTADILGVLNPWMASCPGAFSNLAL